jgi:peptidoglycan/LPS O-acetylase OafA/YrhL
MTLTRAGYIATLDGWRAIAVLLVIGAHATRLMRESQTAIGAKAASFFEHAGFGVDIFFALSGFLICTLLLREKSGGQIDLWAFYRRRFFRIIPPMAMYLVVISVMSALGYLAVSASEIAAVVLFCRN